MSRFPKYSLRGLEGRRILGVDGRLVLVEGIWTCACTGFVDDRSRLLPVEDVADTRSNRELPWSRCRRTTRSLLHS